MHKCPPLEPLVSDINQFTLLKYLSLRTIIHMHSESFQKIITNNIRFRNFIFKILVLVVKDSCHFVKLVAFR